MFCGAHLYIFNWEKPYSAMFGWFLLAPSATCDTSPCELMHNIPNQRDEGLQEAGALSFFFLDELLQVVLWNLVFQLVHVALERCLNNFILTF